jgi:Uma2 family endonuclease
MNQQFRNPLPDRRPHPASTQAADGLPRRKWHVDEVQKMLEAGLIQSSDRFELIGGELVEMAAKNRTHEVVREALHNIWRRACPAHLKYHQEAPLRLGDHDEPEPDFMVYPAALKSPDVRSDTVLLVVECADTSLAYDLGRKALLYASFGVPEYWVINARTHVTTVHTGPSPAGYASIVEVPPEERVVPKLAPELALRLGDLDLE